MRGSSILKEKEKMFSLGWSSLVWGGLLLAALVVVVSKRQNKQRPPGPPGWPVIGNLFDLGTMPHQSLYHLRSKYGPVLWLRLGSMNTMVIQSPKAAAQLFKNHDLNFSDRKCPGVLKAHNYFQGSLAFGGYGPYWRVLRRLCSSELLVTKRINEVAPLRQKCIDAMIGWIEEDARKKESGEVNLSHFLFLLAFNVLGNLMLSRDLLDLNSKEGHDFYNATNGVMEGVGTPNLADFLPWLRWLDLQGVHRRMVRDIGQAMSIVGGFVKERVQDQQFGQEKVRKDFLDALLEFEGDAKEWPHKITDKNIIIIILEMFFAGSDTTSSTIEWGMTELLRQPEIMEKVKEELERVIGPNKKVEESDMDKLPYLQAVVKEILRLHPPVPLLLPRNALQDVNFMGFDIPKDTQVFVNAWAIGRDPDSWSDPLSFKPERFFDSNVDYKGQNFELLPFGSGRRICVGMTLAHRVVHLSLASLLHTFDWDLPNNITKETIDMKERMGVSLRKLVPLKAIPKKRIIS